MSDTLSNAYANSPASAKSQRKLEALAKSFRADSSLEKLLAQRESDPLSYGALSPSLHMQVGYYESAKSAAETLANNAE